MWWLRGATLQPLQILQSPPPTPRLNRSRPGSGHFDGEFAVFFFSSAMQSAVEMGDSAAAQSVEFRPQERPKLLPRFFGKERLSFAKSDNWRGRAAAGCLPLSLREEVHLHQPSSAATTGSALLGVNCKYLLIPLSFLPSLTCSLTLPVPTEETEKKAEASQHVKRK